MVEKFFIVFFTAPTTFSSGSLLCRSPHGICGEYCLLWFSLTVCWYLDAHASIDSDLLRLCGKIGLMLCCRK